jgi:hypothetical protein
MKFFALSLTTLFCPASLSAVETSQGISEGELPSFSSSPRGRNVVTAACLPME